MSHAYFRTARQTCVCVCVRVRVRERERDSESERERKRKRERERDMFENEVNPLSYLELRESINIFKHTHTS